MLKIKATILKFLYNKDDYKIMVCGLTEPNENIMLNDRGNFTVVGNANLVTEGKSYDMNVEPVRHPKYGMQYKLISLPQFNNLTIDSLTPEQELDILINITTPKQAHNINTAYPDFVRLILQNEDEKIDLNKIYNVGEVYFQVYKERIRKEFSFLLITTAFPEYKLSRDEVKTLNRMCNNDLEKVKALIQDNPYYCFCVYNHRNFLTTDKMLKLHRPDLIDSEQRCLCLVYWIVKDNESYGNTRMNARDMALIVQEHAPELLSKLRGFVEKNTLIHYDEETNTVANSDTYSAESFTAHTIKRLLKSPIKWDIDWKQYKNTNGFELTDEQLELLHLVCENNVVILQGKAGCVDCDTEFFTGTEWKRIADYTIGDKVLQYNNDGSAILTYPTKYIKQPAQYLWHFKTKYGLDQCLSDNHNCYYITSKGNLYHKPFIEVRQDQERNGFHGKFITAFNYSGTGINLSDDEIRLMIATFADGSFYTKVDGEQPNRSRFHIKKERKKERLISLAISTNSNYKISNSVADGYTDIYIDVLFRAKHFPADWYNCTKHQLQVIADEVMFWDGRYKNNNDFTTNNKSDADFIQFVFASLGYRATILTQDRTGQKYKTCGKMYTRKSVEYNVNWTKRNLIGLCTDKRSNHTKTKIVPYKTLDGYEYCFTVPSHMLVLRRNNKIFITGNCGKTSATQALITMLEDNDLSYTLVAPTGIASKALSETTGRKAGTIHRTIGTSGSIDTDVLILDEISMCGISHMSMVCPALSEYTKLVMIGDDAQLASIACGNVIKDIQHWGKVPTANLTKVFRYGKGDIDTVATDTRNEKQFLSDDGKLLFKSNNQYKFIQANDNPLQQVIEQYRKLLSSGYSQDDILILTPYNVGAYGTYAINREIQSEFNTNTDNVCVPTKGIKNNNIELQFLKNDRVLNTQNHYDVEVYHDFDRGDEIINTTTNIFNGDIGVVREAHEDYIIVEIDENLIKMSKSQANELLLGNAVTIHKIQGGAAKAIILLTTNHHKRMLSNNLLYVALTRAREQIIHIGDVEAVNRCLHIHETESRNTWLYDMLGGDSD